MSEAAATLGPPERLHPISLLSSLAASARGMWGLFAAGGYFAIQGHWFLLLVTFGIYTAISLGSALIRWRKFSFSVGQREVRIDSGLEGFHDIVTQAAHAAAARRLEVTAATRANLKALDVHVAGLEPAPLNGGG